MNNVSKEKLVGLKEFLASHKNVKTVFFNDNGEWLFVERPEFPNKVGRKEIMDTVIEEEDDDQEKSTESGSETKELMKAKEVIELISIAATAEDVDALIAGDTRKTVLDAAEAKKKSFVTE